MIVRRDQVRLARRRPGRCARPRRPGARGARPRRRRNRRRRCAMPMRARRLDDAAGDLAAIGDQDLGEHPAIVVGLLAEHWRRPRPWRAVSAACAWRLKKAASSIAIDHRLAVRRLQLELRLQLGQGLGPLVLRHGAEELGEQRRGSWRPSGSMPTIGATLISSALGTSIGAGGRCALSAAACCLQLDERHEQLLAGGQGVVSVLKRVGDVLQRPDFCVALAGRDGRP